MSLHRSIHARPTGPQAFSKSTDSRPNFCRMLRPTGILLVALTLTLLTVLLTAVFYSTPAGAQSGSLVLSVTATVPVAGPQPGVFTITRTGDTDQSLKVRYGLSGTASRNVDYTIDSSNSGNPSDFNPPFASGKAGQAFSLNGTNQFVQIPDAPSLRPTNLTIEGWVNFANNVIESTIAGKAVAGSNSDSFVIYYFANSLRGGVGTKDGFTPLIYDFTPTLNVWYHVAFTFDSVSRTQKLYLNGVNVATNTTTFSPPGYDSNPYLIGADTNYGGRDLFFPGKLDEITLYNRALEPTEIQQIFNADSVGKCKPGAAVPNCVPAPPGIVSWFPGEGNITDLASVSSSDSNPIRSPFADGKVAKAFLLNGGRFVAHEEQYLQYPSNPSQDPTAEATVDAWINFSEVPSEAGRSMTVIAKSAQFRFFDLVALGDDRIRFYVGFGSSVGTNTVFQKGQWYHVAATYKANTELKIYVNGVLENTETISETRAANDNPLTIGNSAFDRTRHFGGLIDEAQMYNRALSAPEIQSIFNAGSNGLCKPGIVSGCVQSPAGLTGWWPGDGHTRDLATNRRGTLIGYDDKLAGQEMTFPAGQASITVNVLPLFSPNSAGKTIVLTLQPDSQNNYGLDQLKSSATVALRGLTASTDVSLTDITPNRGGNTGSVTAVIEGYGFKPGVTVKLVRSGQVDIVATQTNPAVDELSVAATFDLSGKTLGVYDVIVANPGGTAKTLPGAFIIETTSPGALFVKVISRKIIRIGNEYNFYIEYGHDSNVDETNVVLYVRVPNFVSITPNTALPFWSGSQGDSTYLAFVVPKVPAGSNAQPEVLALKIKVADPANAHRGFRVRAALFRSTDLFESSVSSAKELSTTLKPLADSVNGHLLPPGPPPPDDPPPPRSDDGGGDTDPRTPNDPNEKSGSGVGEKGYITGKVSLPYTIYFENKDTASLPAQDVVITDQLDPAKVDLSSFSFGVISFGNRIFTPPARQTSFVGYVDLGPQTNLLVRIAADLDAATGRINWLFNSLDRASGRAPEDPLAGFLPPNIISPEGQASVTFNVMPKASLTTNTPITNGARIVFDVNAPIDTNVYLNTTDKSLPTSSVAVLPATQSAHSFVVNWAGTDSESGISRYNVFVSTNGGAFTLWQSDTTATSGIFYGSANTTYRFYSTAVDWVGNQEPAKTNAEATTLTPTGNPITEARWFVHQHYVDFLSREPDSPGLVFWTGEITECSDAAKRHPGESLELCIERKRANTSAAFFLSPEFQNTGSFVVRVYWGTLGKLPNTPKSSCPSLPDGYSGQCRPLYSEYIADASQVANGIVVNDQLDPNVINANKRAFVDQFVNTVAFKAKYDSLTNQQFVDTLFQTTGINASASDRAALVNGLNAQPATETRSSVVFKVVDGTTTQAGGALVFNTTYGKAFYDKEFDDAFVFMEYIGYLRRNPDQGGFEFWLAKLKFYGNWQDAQMVLAFISSPEYRARFGQP